MGPNRRGGYQYRALLVAVLLLLVVYPTLRGPAWSAGVARVMLTAVFLAGGWVVFAAAERLRVLAAVLGGLAVVGMWMGYTLPEEHGRVVAAVLHASAAAFHVCVIVVVLLRIYRERVVSADAVAAALVGYLLLGVVFSHFYCLVRAAVPGSFSGLTAGANEPEVHVQLTYYSFITLTTVGYGDIIPTGDAARSLALVEAVAGQFYLAVLIAELVGKRVAQALSPGPPQP